MKKILVGLLALAATAGAGVTTVPPTSGGNFSCTALACTFTAPLLAPAANNCAAVPYSFTGDSNTGLCSSAAESVSLITDGTARLTSTAARITSTLPLTLQLGSAADPALSFFATGSGLYRNNTVPSFVFSFAGVGGVSFSSSWALLKSDYSLGWSTGGVDAAESGDVTLYRDAAADTLALRRGGTAVAPVPQTFRVYNFCDGAACATGYERVALGWSGNIFSLTAQNAGTGSARAVLIDGSELQFYTSGSERAFVRKSVDLTGGAATTVATVNIAAGTAVGGSLEYTVVARDATDSQTRHGSFHFAAGNKGGTETCTISAASEAADGSVLATTEAAPGTLTYAITCDTSGANAISLQFNGVSSMVETSFVAWTRLNLDCDPTTTASCSVAALP